VGSGPGEQAGAQAMSVGCGQANRSAPERLSFADADVMQPPHRVAHNPKTGSTSGELKSEPAPAPGPRLAVKNNVSAS
jgi:hypothetical protein